MRTPEFAIYSGFAALNIEHVDVIHADLEENQNALSLVDRAVLLWVVVVAVFTLGGWL
jgi:membrane protein required for beta-lactamase induction